MTDYDFIWRTQDEIRTVVNAVLGECIWNLSYSERRMAIELELTVTLDDDAISNLCCQFPISADYDGLGARGTKIVSPLLIIVTYQKPLSTLLTMWQKQSLVNSLR